MRIAFITGATGFLGINLCRQLVAAGVEVHALRRASSNTFPLDRLPIHWHQGDVTDLDSLMAACPDQVDVFFHAAADTNMWRGGNELQTRINMDGTRHAIDTALAKSAGRFIHTSSIAAYGPQPEVVIREETPQLGHLSFSNYYRTKQLSETLVKQAVEDRGLPAVIMNPCHIVGAPDAHNWSQLMMMVAQNSLPGVPPGRGSFCDVKEVAKAHIAAVQLGALGENYILSGAEMSFVEFVAEIGQIVGKPTPKKATPGWVLKALAQVSEWGSAISGKVPELTPEKALIACDELRADSKKAQQTLGYRADIEVRAPLTDCYDWLKATGQL